MAVSFSGLSALADETRLAFFTDAIAANDVLPFVRQYGDFIPNVKADTYKLRRLSTSLTIADGSNCFTSADGNNDNTISERSISLKKGLIRDEICPHDGWETYYTHQGMTAGQHYTGLGAFEAGLLADIAKRAGKAIGNEMWNGGSNWITSGWVDQLYAAFGIETGASTTPTAGGSTGTDAEGAFNICQLLVDSVMANVDFGFEARAGNVIIVMSPKEYSFYFQNYRKLYGDNLVAPGLATLANGSPAPVYHPGTRIEIVQQNFLTGSGTIVITRKGNFAAAIDLESDFSEIKVGMDQYDEKMWWKMRFKGGVGINDISANSLLYYGPAS
jgi:hypothetical protein